MNYRKHYDKLINRARNRYIIGYVEKHHIIPRCIGGSNSKDNIVSLTPEEHYVAHQLLVKIFPEYLQLIRALSLMVAGKRAFNNKLYGWIRRKISESRRGVPLSAEHREAIRLAGGHPHTKESRRKIGDANRGRKRPDLARVHEGNRGRPLSESHKAKLSAALKGRKRNAITISKTANGNRGRKNTTEAIERMRIAQRLKWTPEMRAKLSKSMTGKRTGYRHSAETKIKMRESALNRWRAMCLG